MLVLSTEIKVEKGYTRILSAPYNVVNCEGAWEN